MCVCVRVHICVFSFACVGLRLHVCVCANLCMCNFQTVVTSACSAFSSRQHMRRTQKHVSFLTCGKHVCVHVHARVLYWSVYLHPSACVRICMLVGVNKIFIFMFTYLHACARVNVFPYGQIRLLQCVTIDAWMCVQTHDLA